MNTYKFKTNINCNGCINTVKPVLSTEKINKWDVDISTPEKILTIESDKLSSDEIKKILSEIGYFAELI